MTVQLSPDDVRALRLALREEQRADAELMRLVALARANHIATKQALAAIFDRLAETHDLDPLAEFTFDERAGTLTPKE